MQPQCAQMASTTYYALPTESYIFHSSLWLCSWERRWVTPNLWGSACSDLLGGLWPSTNEKRLLPSSTKAACGRVNMCFPDRFSSRRQETLQNHEVNAKKQMWETKFSRVSGHHGVSWGQAALLCVNQERQLFMLPFLQSGAATLYLHLKSLLEGLGGWRCGLWEHVSTRKRNPC